MNEITFLTEFKTLEEFTVYMFGFCFAVCFICLFAYDCLKGTVNVITKFINTVLIRLYPLNECRTDLRAFNRIKSSNV